MNSGYHGFSMSKRAVEAYDNGERPLSKWSKKDIIEEIIEMEYELGVPLDKIKKIPLTALKSLVLSKSSWHHTSKYANKSSFYSIDPEKLSSLSEEIINAAISSASTSPDTSVSTRYVKVRYGVWEGTRKHPKLAFYTSLGTVTGNVYLSHNKVIKKLITGKHFTILEEYDETAYRDLTKNLFSDTSRE